MVCRFADFCATHFTVFEDKVQQNITLFKQEDIPLSIGLVIDGSGSMTDKLERLNTAAVTFVRESNPDDETSIISFADEAKFLEQDFTKNTRKLSQALSGSLPTETRRSMTPYFWLRGT